MKTLLLIIIRIFNGYRPAKLELPAMGKQVLCYWNEFGEDTYMICRLTERQDKIIFEGWDEGVSQEDVTHWKYLSKPLVA